MISFHLRPWSKAKDTGTLFAIDISVLYLERLRKTATIEIQAPHRRDHAIKESIMEKFSAADLRRLIAHRVDQCVSLFMPTYPQSHESAQDAVRLKNLADRAQSQLEKHGMRSAEARDLLRPVREMVLDEVYWLERSHGLAMFLRSEG